MLRQCLLLLCGLKFTKQVIYSKKIKVEKFMFWDKIAFLYDLFETVYNKKCFQNLGYAVADLIDEKDNVLECACGTGAISLPVAEKCHCLVATDFSVKMLKFVG